MVKALEAVLRGEDVIVALLDDQPGWMHEEASGVQPRPDQAMRSFLEFVARFCRRAAGGDGFSVV
jgi:hypothetical protein